MFSTKSASLAGSASVKGLKASTAAYSWPFLSFTSRIEIIEQNYRYKRAEIDIIALKDDWLVFIEVKFRKGNSFGHPEEFVSENQQQLIVQAADDYIAQINWKKNIRFDIITINPQLGIEHFEDAFY